MLKIENDEIHGWEPALRGMRNPKNSWDRSDTHLWESYEIGQNDMKLASTLAAAGPVRGKFLRMIAVYLDVIAPLYWWKEYDTYKVGTVANSCSTMHKIAEKRFTIYDFSYEHLEGVYLENLQETIRLLNDARDMYLWTLQQEKPLNEPKTYWWQMIQLLPSSYNQRRTVMLNYAVLANMYHSRRDHKLDEWHTFCDWIETLPYAQLITGNSKEE